MTEGILDMLPKRPNIQTYIIVSGDVYFTWAIERLHYEGKQAIVAADPLRTSKELRRLADEYLPVGKLGYWVQMLDRLERVSNYLTFGYVVRTLKITPGDLTEMISKRLVIQKKVDRPSRGARSEIRLNRQAYAVALALDAHPA